MRWIFDPQAHQEIWNVSCMTCYHGTLLPTCFSVEMNDNSKQKQTVSWKILKGTLVHLHVCFREPMEYWQNIDLLVHFVADSDVCVCDNLYQTQFLGNVRTKFRHAAGPLQTNPFPKCCTDCPTMALKGYTGLLCWWHAGFRSHVHGKFSLLKHPIL